MPLPRIQRGKLSRVDLGYLGKVRPVLVVSVPFSENDLRWPVSLDRWVSRLVTRLVVWHRKA